MSENLNERGVLIHEFVYRNWLHFFVNMGNAVKTYYKFLSNISNPPYDRQTDRHNPHVVMGERNPEGTRVNILVL